MVERLRRGGVLRPLALAILLTILFGALPSAETGRDLWLRYALIGEAGLRGTYARIASTVVVSTASATGAIIAAELQRGLSGLLGVNAPLVPSVTTDGALIVGTPATSSVINGLGWAEPIARAGREGYVIRSAKVGGHAATVIASETEIGALHGAFRFLRLLQTRQPVGSLDIVERPAMPIRILNHWDNLVDSERGYAGAPIWDWAGLPDRVSPRIAAYADRIVFLKDGTIVNETRLGNGGDGAKEPAGQESSQALAVSM